MLARIIIVNGQKKIEALTADAGAGLPVGFIAPAYKKGNYSGWLYLDGSTFDETKYPLLYAYLGSNVLPDYREVAITGAEQNTTDTIATHDVYTEGEFKDDQFQSHDHTIQKTGSSAIYTAGTGSGNYAGFAVSAGTASNVLYAMPNSGRKGDVTRGKRKAVFFYIKATSGLSENAQDNVVAQLNEERSYSTEEVNTGKKWFDGKPIYRKVITSSTGIAHNTVLIENVDTVINAGGTQQYLDNEYYNFPWIMSVDNNIRWVLKNDNKIYTNVQISYTYKNVKWWFEYTKTTD